MPSFSFPIGSVLKALTVCTIPGQVSVNSRSWQLTELTGAAAFLSTDFINQYDTFMFAGMNTLLSNSATYYGTMLYLRNPIGPAPRPDTINTNTDIGTGGVGLMPTQACGLISFYTATLGKTGQGRMYVPFASPDSLSVDGTPTVGYQTDLDNLGSFLSTDIVVTVGPVTGRFAPIMYQGGAAPALFITGFKSHNAWATQRKRGAYGRTNVLPF